ncbi:arsenate reductase ArsC [Pelomicrobium sp.]|jgi:arsenate reductase|uniref:arsenate reductase ArsC n=1 Tax=Pelomicrobium sp. TaxID=2815319 RepID=UPI002FDE466B
MSRERAPGGGNYNVLFLCTGNSARSILAEALLRHYGGKRFNAYSAGSHPTGRINPFVLEFLAAQRLPTEGLRSKSWDEFARPNAPPLHFVFTVCDNAAGEVCPVWPGQPLTAHWSVEDPARYMDDPDEARQAVRDAFRLLSRRISLFVSLPLEKLDRLALQQRIEEIGRTS